MLPHNLMMKSQIAEYIRTNDNGLSIAGRRSGSTMKITLPNVRSIVAGIDSICSLAYGGIRLLAGSLALAVTLTTCVAADDTEIFFSQNGDASNVLFILDTSGSMSSRDGGSTSRLQRMQDALNQLLDKISGINVGVMSYTSRRTMGLKQPIRTLDDTHKNNMKGSVNALRHGGGTPTSVSYTHLTLPTILLV